MFTFSSPINYDDTRFPCVEAMPTNLLAELDYYFNLNLDMVESLLIQNYTVSQMKEFARELYSNTYH